MARKDTLKASAAIPAPAPAPAETAAPKTARKGKTAPAPAETAAPAPAETAAPKGKGKGKGKTAPAPAETAAPAPAAFTKEIAAKSAPGPYVGQEKTMFRVTPDELHVQPGYNTRSDFNIAKNSEDEELYNSILATGIETPFVVEIVNGYLFILAGHRRKAALDQIAKEGKAIPGSTVPVIAERAGLSDDDRDIHIVKSNQYKEMSPLERGRVLARLRHHMWPDHEIAKEAGISLRWVQALCGLAMAPKIVTDAIDNGNLASTAALMVMQQDGPVNANRILTLAMQLAPKTGKKAGRVTDQTIDAARAQIAASDPDSGIAPKRAAPAGTAPAGTAPAGTAPAGTAPAAKPAERQSATPTVRTGALPDDGSAADLDGPFMRVGSDVADVHGRGIASCDGIPVARAVCEMLNKAWEGRAPARRPAATAGKPAAKPADVPPAHVAARKGRQGIRTSRGR